MINIRKMNEHDIETIESAFKKQGWNKSKSQYETYLKEQSENIRLVLIAEINGEFAGYVTLVYNSNYPYFKENQIQEIMDFNVLKKFQHQGVGTALMNEVERLVSLKAHMVGLRVGLTGDYGNAQNLYIKRGYEFDKLGLSFNDETCHYNDEVIVNDDLVMGMTKKLNRKE